MTKNKIRHFFPEHGVHYDPVHGPCSFFGHRRDRVFTARQYGPWNTFTGSVHRTAMNTKVAGKIISRFNTPD